MKIAIIGAGNVGGTLGTRWAKNGHVVTFGVRNPGEEKVKKLLRDAGSNTRAATIADAKLGSQSASMFVCGDDAEARATVMKLADELGFEPVDCGALSAARYLEPMAMLWIHLCVGLGRGPDFAFKIVKR